MRLKRAAATALQYILPHKTLSRIAYKLARIRYRPLKNWMIIQFVETFQVNLDEAISPNPDDYEHFNAFFTRALKPGVRPISPGQYDLVSPVDGRISQLGPIRQGRIIQAKGFDFTVAELLAGDPATAAAYDGGQFITIYLSPRDYHRIHMPLDGQPLESVHVPGRLFSVADWTTQSIPRLFARNERLVCYFDTPAGKMPLVMVGAMLVSSMETVFHGEVTPPYAKKVTVLAPDPATGLQKGQEMGRFNYGSTVILLFPKGSMAFLPELQAGDGLKMGQKIGHWFATPTAD
jgi:phosphatidylserine decarboxylase